MKQISHLMLAILMLLGTVNSNAQSGYHYNQAKAFNEYIGDGSGKWTLKAKKDSEVQDVIFTRVSLNKKDLQGNELYRYDYKTKNGEEWSLVPDNHYYPIAYVSVRHGKSAKNSANFLFKGNTYLALGSGLIVCVEFIESGSSIEQDNDYKRIICLENDANLLDQRKKNFISYESFVKGSGKGMPYGNWSEFVKAEEYKFAYSPTMGRSTAGIQYKGLDSLYSCMSRYIAHTVSKVKEKGYTALMDECTDGEYYYYGDPHVDMKNNSIQPGPVRLQFVRENNKLSKIIVQSSFEDGKFYDKEKFFYTINAGFARSELDNCLFPFDDMIIFGYYYRESMQIRGVFSKNKFDLRAWNMVGPSGSGSRLCLFLKTSEKYFCQTELEKSYDEKKDKLYFFNMTRELYKAYKGIK